MDEGDQKSRRLDPADAVAAVVAWAEEAEAETKGEAREKALGSALHCIVALEQRAESEERICHME